MSAHVDISTPFCCVRVRRRKSTAGRSQSLPTFLLPTESSAIHAVRDRCRSECYRSRFLGGNTGYVDPDRTSGCPRIVWREPKGIQGGYPRVRTRNTLLGSRGGPTR